MPSSQVVISQEDFSLGMVRADAPHLIPPTGVYDCKNGLLNDDGSIFWRGGSANYSDAAFDTGLTFLWDGYVSAGRRTFFASASNFGVLNGTTPVNLGGDGLSLPVSATEIEGMLFIGGGYIYAGSLKTAPYSTGTVTVTNGSKTVTGSGTTWNTLVDAGMMMQLGNGRLYVVASVTDATHLELRDAYEGSGAAGQSYTLHNIYEITTADPYEASATYAVSTNRLLWHTGRGVRFSPLRTTYPIAYPHSHGVNDEHTVPEGAEVVGVASLGPSVLIFTTGGIWRLSGLAYDIVSADGVPQHQMEPLTRDIILWGAAGISSWEQFLIVPATDGVYLLDGISSPVRISKNIDPLYQDYVANGWRPGGAAVYRGSYLLPILDGAGHVKDVLVTRLDRAVSDRRRKVVFPWTRLQDSGAEIAGYAVRNTSDPQLPKLLGAEIGTHARIADCSGYFTPEASNKNDADGTTPSFEIVFRDYGTGALTLNRLKRVRLGYELIDAASDDPRLMLDYGSGLHKPNAPKWGDPAGAWGTGFGPLGTSPWTASVESEFEPVYRGGVRQYAPETEQEPFNFLIRGGNRVRYARLRLRADERPAESCVIRRLELFVQPSLAVRR